MKKNLIKASLLMAGFLMVMPSAVKAQDKLEAHASATFTNEYIWRGFDQGQGFAVQPSATLGYKGFALNFWGSTPVTANAASDKREFDINLSYTTGGLTLMVSDYWWGGKNGRYGYYEHDKSGATTDSRHHFEGTVAYNFGESFPLTLSWSTWFAGADAVKFKNGKRAYSTYINAAYNFNLPADVTLTPSVGFTPWEGYYSHSATSSQDKAWFTDLSLKASKNVKVTKNFEIPVFVQTIFSPATDKAFLVGGFTLGF